MELLLQKIGDVYGLKLRLVEKVSQGFLSENYILSDGVTKYFLKKYRYSDRAVVEGVHRSKRFFFEGGIPVIMPLPTGDGGTFFEYEAKFYTLFPFVADRQLQWNEVHGDSLVSYAQTLARIHILGRNATVAVSHFFKPWDSVATLKTIDAILQKISELQTKTEFDVLAEKNLKLKEKVISSNNKTYSEFNMESDHLLHGDYTVANVFFGTDGNVSYVFDWEKTEYAPRFLEMFRSLIQCTLGDHARSKIYLDAYLALYPATREELERGLDAYALKQTHSLWIEEEHYLKGSTRTDVLIESDSFKIDYFAHKLDEFKREVFH